MVSVIVQGFPKIQNIIKEVNKELLKKSLEDIIHCGLDVAGAFVNPKGMTRNS